MPHLHARFPKLELLLVEEKTEVVHQRLRDGELDVGVLALPIHDDQLHAEPLFSRGLRARRARATIRSPRPTGPVDPSVLAGENVLLLEEGHCLRDQALAVCRLAGAAERTGFRATSLETLRQMVAAGVGVTLLPELAVRPPVPPSDDIVLLRFSEPVPRRADRHVLAPHERLPRPLPEPRRGDAHPPRRLRPPLPGLRAVRRASRAPPSPGSRPNVSRQHGRWP